MGVPEIFLFDVRGNFKTLQDCKSDLRSEVRFALSGHDEYCHIITVLSHNFKKKAFFDKSMARKYDFCALLFGEQCRILYKELM